MINKQIARARQLLLILALQVLVLDYVHLWGYATPMLGVMVVVYSPLSENRMANMLTSFMLGIVMDMFANTPGVAAGAMTLASYVHHPLLGMMVPKDSEEDMVPSIHTMGAGSYITYMGIMLCLYHVAYFVLEVFSFARPMDMLYSMSSSFALSFVLAISFETFRFRKKGRN